jgi:hypothetical protein
VIARAGLLGLALGFGTTAVAGGPPKNGIRWGRDFDAAFAEAKQRHVPVMIAFIQDGEKQNDDEPDVVYPDAKVIKASRAVVCLVASRGTAKEHGETSVTEGGQSRQVCSKFGGVSCLEHQQIETVAFRTYTNGTINTPCHIFASPDGKEMFRFDDYADAAGLIRLMKQATDKLGPGVPLEEWDAMKQSISEADALYSSRSYGAAATKYLAISAKAYKIPTVDRARERLAEIERLGADEIAAATAKLSAKDWAGGYAGLARTALVFKGARAEKDARARLADLEKNPEAGDAHKLAAIEQKARPLFDQAEALAQKGLADKSEALLRKLVETYPAAPCASIARDRLGLDAPDAAPPKH